VASLLNRCGEPLDPGSFAGQYAAVVGGRKRIGGPGELLPFDGIVVEKDGELLLEIDSREGEFLVNGVPHADGTLSFEGSLRRTDGGISPASGSGAAFVEGTTRWITGDLEFVRPGTDPPETDAIRFSMRR
jgi:hypothetical protein